MSTNDLYTVIDPIGIFHETSKAEKARKNSKGKKQKPRQTTSGESVLSGSQTATSGTLLG